MNCDHLAIALQERSSEQTIRRSDLASVELNCPAFTVAAAGWESVSRSAWFAPNLLGLSGKPAPHDPRKHSEAPAAQATGKTTTCGWQTPPNRKQN
jgi:hypothetical protein